MTPRFLGCCDGSSECALLAGPYEEIPSCAWNCREKRRNRGHKPGADAWSWGRAVSPPRVTADPSAARTEPTRINSEWISFNTSIPGLEVLDCQ